MFSVFNPDPPRQSPELQRLDLTARITTQRKRLCLVSSDKGSSLALAALLSKQGWTVTLLDLSPNPAPSQDEHPFSIVHLFGHYGNSLWYVPVQSLCVYHYLRENPCDVVVFHHGFGAGYFCFAARKLGLAFAATILTTHVSSAHAYDLEASQQWPKNYGDYEINFLEQAVIRQSDAVIFQDDALVKWMLAAGWQLPENGAVIAGPDQQHSLAFDKWLAALPAHQGQQAATGRISISVCLATYNRPDRLDRALQSLTQQTDEDFQTVVVNDGSTHAEMPMMKRKWQETFAKRRWIWAEQPNTGPSQARNHAVRLASGDYVLFMDDDNIACCDEIERFRLAARSGSDIICCMLGMHPDSKMSMKPVAFLPDAHGGQTRPLGWIPLGDCLELAPFLNRMGETNSLFKKSVFEALGGFQGSRHMVFEDVEFLLRATLAGHRIDVLPEILLLYHRNDDSRSMGGHIFTSHLESLKPLARILPPSMRGLLLAARAEWFERHRLRQTKQVETPTNE